MGKITGRCSMVLLLLMSVQGYAHHGPGIYDLNKTVSVTGPVALFRFINPHVLIYLTVTNEDGPDIQWAGEMTSPNRLARMSLGNVKWHKELLKPGDVITVTGNPARNGAPALLLNKVEDAEGNVLSGRGR